MDYAQLRKLRLKNNFSLKEMADVLGLKTPGGYYRIESGENKLKAEHLPLLAKKFGVDLDSLMMDLFLDHELEQSSNFDHKPA